MTGLRALLTLSVACAGCATTGGHDWLNEPLAPLQQRAQLAPPAAEAPEAGFDSRPRLNHTVTLGESYLIESNRVAQGAAPFIQVNVQTHVPVVVNSGYGYSGYGYNPYAAYGYGRVTAVRASARTASAPAKVGLDFPPPADYGPRAMR